MGYSKNYVSDEVAPSSVHRLGPETTKYLSVTEFKAHVYVHIRNFLPSLSNNGLLKPMTGGIALTVPRWNQLVANIGNIDLEIQSINELMTIKRPFYHKCTPISLGSDTQLCVAACVHKGEVKIHIREYVTYEEEIVDGVLHKTGKYYPTAKGIALNVDEWCVLTNAKDYIEARVPYLSMTTQTTNFEYADQDYSSTHATPPRFYIDSDVKTEQKPKMVDLETVQEEMPVLERNETEDGNIKQKLRKVLHSRAKRPNNIPLPTQTPKKRKTQNRRHKLERQNALDDSTISIEMLDNTDLENIEKFFDNFQTQLAEEPQVGIHTPTQTNSPDAISFAQD